MRMGHLVVVLSINSLNAVVVQTRVCASSCSGAIQDVSQGHGCSVHSDIKKSAVAMGGRGHLKVYLFAPPGLRANTTSETAFKLHLGREHCASPVPIHVQEQ